MSRKKIKQVMPMGLKAYEAEHGKYKRADWQRFRAFHGWGGEE